VVRGNDRPERSAPALTQYTNILMVRACESLEGGASDERRLIDDAVE
jgi:hypothetical protein